MFASMKESRAVIAAGDDTLGVLDALSRGLAGTVGRGLASGIAPQVIAATLRELALLLDREPEASEQQIP